MSFSKPMSLLMRGLQFLFTLLSLSLASALVDQQAHHGTAARLNYSLFTAVYSMLALLYLIPSSIIEHIASPLATAALDGTCALFYFCAGIAMAAGLGGKSCGNHEHQRNNNLINGGGYHNPEKRCREAQALTAFEWFAFAAFIGSAFFSLLALRTGGSGRGPGNLRSARPMTQV